MNPNSTEEVKELATFVEGMSAGTSFPNTKQKLERVAHWLSKLSSHVCAQGYIGCHGGKTCTSDHK